jgi:tetratricopeptide (TPR) repeat protein
VIARLLVLAVVLGIWSTAEGAPSLVVQKREICDYFIVETRNGFAVVEAAPAADAVAGSELEGRFHGRGRRRVRNVESGSSFDVVIVGSDLTRPIAQQDYEALCLLQLRLRNPKTTAEDLYVAASMAGRVGSRNEQEALLRRLLAGFSEHRLARHAALELARAASWRAEWVDVATYAREATDSDDVAVRAEAWLLFGEAELRRRQLRAAIKAFRHATDTPGVDPWVRYRALAGMGYAHEQLGEVRLARAAYEEVVRETRDSGLRRWIQQRLDSVKAAP